MTRCHCCDSTGMNTSRNVGPLVDMGAPYSAIIAVELATLRCELLKSWNDMFDPNSQSLPRCEYWQYSSRDHASAPRKIVGTITLPLLSDCGMTVFICHLVFDGSSQWVIGQNVICNGTVRQIDNPLWTVHGNDHQVVKFILLSNDRLLYIHYESFFKRCRPSLLPRRTLLL